jgi:deoxyribodipyrimidine photolyase
MKTVIEMAREAGATPYTNRHYPDRPTHTFNPEQLERFAALVIANHPPQSYMTWQEGYEAGKQAERERLQAFMRQMIDAYSLQSDPSGLKARSST